MALELVVVVAVADGGLVLHLADLGQDVRWSVHCIRRGFRLFGCRIDGGFAHSITRILTGARPPPVRTLTCTTVHNFLRAQHKVLFVLAVLPANADDKHDTRPVDLKACSKTWCCLASDQQSSLSPTSFMTPGRGKRGGVLSPCHSPSTPPFPCWLCASYTINNPWSNW